MIHRFILSFDATIDLEETEDYYLNISERLVYNFWTEFDNTIFRIRENPNQFQKKYEDVRIAFFESLPFGIHFEIDEDLIKIARVLHFKRNF